MTAKTDITETFTTEDWKRVASIKRDADSRMSEIDKEFFLLWKQVKSKHDGGQRSLRGVDRAEYLAYQLFRFSKTGVLR